MRLPSGLSHNFANESEFSSASSNSEVYTRFQDTGIHTSVTLHKLSHFRNRTKFLFLIFPIQFAGPATASNLLMAAAEKRSASNHS